MSNLKHTKTLGSITYGYEADTPEDVVALIKAITLSNTTDGKADDMLKTAND